MSILSMGMLLMFFVACDDSSTGSVNEPSNEAVSSSSTESKTTSSSFASVYSSSVSSTSSSSSLPNSALLPLMMSSSSVDAASEAPVKPCKTASVDTCIYGTLTDARDGQTYKTVYIGSQVWMAENLNYQGVSSACSVGGMTCSGANRFYGWYDAKAACPEGWHLPMSFEYEMLLESVGGASTAGLKLKTISWKDSEKRSVYWTDQYGFGAYPAGDWDKNMNFDFDTQWKYAGFWTSSTAKDDTTYAYNVVMFYSTDGVGITSNKKKDRKSVRCIQDNDEWKRQVQIEDSLNAVELSKFFSYTTGSFVDERDQQTYKTVTIDTLTWMAANLNFAMDSSYCYDNEPANCEKYGRLYEQNVIDRACPNGWRVPTKQDFERLVDLAGGKSIAGMHLKSVTGWAEHEGIRSTDTLEFSGLPAGYGVGVDGVNSFYSEGMHASFWCSTPCTKNNDLYNLGLSESYDAAPINCSTNIFPLSHSIRCVKTTK